MHKLSLVIGACNPNNASAAHVLSDSLLSEDTDNTSDGKLIDVEEGDNEDEEEEDIGTKAFNEEAGTLPSASSFPAAIPEALLVNSSESSASAPFLGTAERSSSGTGKGAGGELNVSQEGISAVAVVDQFPQKY